MCTVDWCNSNDQFTNFQTPFNEELDAQMANLEGLMKDLNGVISSSEFEC